METVARTGVLLAGVAGIAALVLIVMPDRTDSGPRNADTTNNSANATSSMQITSTAFNHGSAIPAQYTCDGANGNPPLTFEDVPAETASLVLIMDDPDIPQEVTDSIGVEVFDHWVVYNMLPTITEIPENTTPEGQEGQNSGGSVGYTGPCPPSQYEPAEHRYFFKLYALDTEMNLPDGAGKEDVEAALEGHIIQEAELMGTYQRGAGDA